MSLILKMGQKGREVGATVEKEFSKNIWRKAGVQ